MATTGIRLLAALPLVLLAAAVVAQPPVAPAPHPTLAQLLKDYRRYGLPFPPDDAELVRIKWWINQPENPCILAFRVPPAKPGDDPRYLWGGWLWEMENVDPEHVEPVEPVPAALRDVSMPIHHLLPLAAQCEARGWHDLARAVYQRARDTPARAVCPRVMLEFHHVRFDPAPEVDLRFREEPRRERLVECVGDGHGPAGVERLPAVCGMQRRMKVVEQRHRRSSCR
ncbi:MAG TPA: hypothetical protein VKE74_22585 [Gemmataceae bacterium]|nr:hypothetical protein [Gemmataceae bacterium]